MAPGSLVFHSKPSKSKKRQTSKASIILALEVCPYLWEMTKSSVFGNVWAVLMEYPGFDPESYG